jgi:hypothetical protein
MVARVNAPHQRRVNSRHFPLALHRAIRGDRLHDHVLLPLLTVVTVAVATVIVVAVISIPAIVAVATIVSIASMVAGLAPIAVVEWYDRTTAQCRREQNADGENEFHLSSLN